MPAKRASTLRRRLCGTHCVSSRHIQAMPSMPCANTSGMPALRAKSMSMCTGLWSPEAPANSASVVRFTAGSVSGGSSWPTSMRRRLWFMRVPQCLQTITVRSSATSSSRWLRASAVLTTNSSAPPFLS